MTLKDILAEADAIRLMEQATAERSAAAAGQAWSFIQMREHVESIVHDEQAATARWQALTAQVEGKRPARAAAKKPVADLVKAQLAAWSDGNPPVDWGVFAKQNKLNPESVMAAVRRYTKKKE